MAATRYLAEDGKALFTEAGGFLDLDAITAPVKLQSNFTDTAFTSGTTVTCTFASPLTPGSKLIVFASCSSNVTITYTDTATLTWATLNTHFNGNIPAQNGIGWADNPASSASSVVVTATFGASNTSHTLGISEWVGLATGTVDTQTVGKTNAAATTAPDVSMTTTVNNDLLISCMAGEAAAITAGAGWTLIGGNGSNGTGWEYQVQAVAGSITPTFNLGASNQSNVISAAFKAV